MSLFDNNLINIYKTMVGLTNVDNTSDLNKPISNATQTGLNSKLNLTGGTLTGGLTGTTASFSGDVIASGINILSLISSKLNLTGGTLTGGLTGTTASFSGDVTSNGVSISSLNSNKLNLTGGTLTGGLTGTTASFSADLTVLGRIFCNLPNYMDNTAAKNAGIPIGALYRTGGIIKIRLDDIPPVITLIGNATMNVTSTNQYSEPGILITDNINLNLSTSVISILKDSVELLTSPISISNTPSYITYLSDSTFVITYLGKDDVGNLSITLQRTVNVIMPFTMTLKPMSISGFDTVYTSANITNIVYTNGTYMVGSHVYINSKMYPAYLTSTDGVNWTYNNYFVTYFSSLVPSVEASILKLVGANGRFIMRCRVSETTYSFYSDDGGNSWNFQYNILYQRFTLESIRAVNNVFFYNLSNSPYTAYRSLDGITWTQCTGTRVDNYGLHAYGNGIYVSASRAGNVIVSTDGLNWNTNVALRGYVIESYESVRNIAFGNGKFVLTNYDTGYTLPQGATGTNYILYSTNGISWTRVELPYYNNLKYIGNPYIGINSLNYHKNKFVMQLYDSIGARYVFTSSDAISWNIETYSFTKNLADCEHISLNNILFYPVTPITKSGSSYYPFLINQ